MVTKGQNKKKNNKTIEDIKKYIFIVYVTCAILSALSLQNCVGCPKCCTRCGSRHSTLSGKPAQRALVSAIMRKDCEVMGLSPTQRLRAVHHGYAGHGRELAEELQGEVGGGLGGEALQ